MLPHTQKRRRLVLAGIATSLTTLLGGIAFVQFQANRSWSLMQQHVQNLKRSWSDRALRREPLWGDTVEGCAETHYEHALQIAGTLRAAATDRLRAVRLLSDTQVAADAPAVLQPWQPVLRALHDGAHATQVTPSGSSSDAIANLLDYRWITNAAVLQARVLRLAGHDVEAVQLTLDAAMFAADLMRRGVLVNQMIGTATLAISTSEAWNEAALSMLDAAALELLATGLERLDRSLPATIDQTGELLFLANSLQNATHEPELLATPSAWRYGFSSRWMLADAFVMAADAADELANARDVAWSERTAQLADAGRALSDSGNPVGAMIAPNLSAAEGNVRQTLATLRLLRMSVAMHRGIDAPPLPDPLGDGPLQISTVDNGVRIASVDAEEHSWLARVVTR